MIPVAALDSTSRPLAASKSSKDESLSEVAEPLRPAPLSCDLFNAGPPPLIRVLLPDPGIPGCCWPLADVMAAVTFCNTPFIRTIIKD